MPKGMVDSGVHVFGSAGGSPRLVLVSLSLTPLLTPAQERISHVGVPQRAQIDGHIV